MCTKCWTSVNVLRGILPKLRNGVSKVSRSQIFVIYAITFLAILPVLCHRLKFSVYYNRPNKRFSQEMMRKENTERIQSALKYFHMLNTTKLHGMLGKESHNETAVDVAINIITVSRNRHRVDNYEPKYLTQVVWRLLALLHDAQANGFTLHVHLSVCNVDSDPESYTEARRLASLIQVYNRFTKLSLSMDHPLEKEKDDYTFCLRKSLELNPRYVLLIEDDALPMEDFFPVLQHMIRTRLDKCYVSGSLVPNPNPGAYVKLYHPDRLLGFFSPEVERLPQLISFGLFFGTIAAFIYTRQTWDNRSSQPKYWQIWLWFFIYFVLIALAVGRVNLIQFWRLFSPNLYTLVAAPECCTPAMLFPREGAIQVANMLQTVKCKMGYGKDMAIWKWRKTNKIPAYMVQPNMVTHIGMYSALRTAILDPFIV